MNLWNKKPLKLYGSRMSESILAILCHIIKGEGVIRVCTSSLSVILNIGAVFVEYRKNSKYWDMYV